MGVAKLYSYQIGREQESRKIMEYIFVEFL